MEALKLSRVGRNGYGVMAYVDEVGRYYFDTNENECQNPTELCESSSPFDIDGEPDNRLEKDFVITNPYSNQEIRENSFRFQYQMLSRLNDDCIAFFGKTGEEEKDKWDCRYHNQHNIWGDTIEGHVKEMKRLWNVFPDDLKPEWCTWDQIMEFERKAVCFTSKA